MHVHVQKVSASNSVKSAWETKMVWISVAPEKNACRCVSRISSAIVDCSSSGWCLLHLRFSNRQRSFKVRFMDLRFPCLPDFLHLLRQWIWGWGEKTGHDGAVEERRGEERSRRQQQSGHLECSIVNDGEGFVDMEGPHCGRLPVEIPVHAYTALETRPPLASLLRQEWQALILRCRCHGSPTFPRHGKLLLPPA